MEYIKKVLVLSQISDGFSLNGKRLSGIARIEITEGVATFYLSTINFSAVSGGTFYAFIMDQNKKLYSFDLGLKPTSLTKVFENLPKIEKGFSAGISFIKDDLPVLVAFASSEGLSVNAIEFKKAIIDSIISAKRKNKILPKDIPPIIPLSNPERQAPDKQPTDLPDKLNLKYDDEAVATENYYEKDLDFMQKLKIIEDLDGDHVRAKNGVSNIRSEAQTQKNGACDNGFQNERDNSGGEEYSQANPYYLSAKKELSEIFLKFPEEETLTKNLKDSTWAKITYSENKYYVVGLIREKGKEKYICYGVPAKYSENPPKELEGFCSFIPLSIFDLKGDGYWMMFQDAITGKCVNQKQV